MQENTLQQATPTRTLSFNPDGSIDPAQLEGFPQDFIDRVTSPEFQRQAAAEIARAESHRKFLDSAKRVRQAAQAQAELRRPSGISGRQRKRLRKSARRMAVVGFKAKQEDARNGEEC